jgi:large conductance mechanosensitive channel
MLRDFRDFLFKQNALALAVGVIIGAAIGRVVQSVAIDLLMPVIGLAMPGGDWRTARIVLSETIGKDGQPVVSAINTAPSWAPSSTSRSWPSSCS